jgi:hypothetical protein
MSVINGSPIGEFVASYQFDASDEGFVHTPTFHEQTMIEDAICSFISDSNLLNAALGTVALPHAGKVSEELWALCYLHDWNLPAEGQEHRWEPGKNVFPQVHAFYTSWHDAEAIRKDMTNPEKYWVVCARSESEARMDKARAALSSQQAEAVPVTWRYDIQYGPDGEANYAWVYDEHNNLVCTAKTHHAIAIVQRASSPAPADAEEPSESAQIKPLVWHGPDFEDEYWAYELDKAYTIGRHVDQGRWLGGVGGYFPSVEAAKAAAQADYEARIRSVFVPATSPAKEGE